MGYIRGDMRNSRFLFDCRRNRRFYYPECNRGCDFGRYDSADIIFGVGLILSVSMFVIKKLDKKREREELTNEVQSV